MAQVTNVEAFTTRIPIPETIHLGSMRLVDREYVIARITADDGHVGHAYALTRDLPVAPAIRGLVGPRLIGADPQLVGQFGLLAERALAPAGTDGVLARALSLIDVALWDLKALHAGLPLWQLLGGTRTRVPVMLVGGYPRDGHDARAAGERLAGHLVAGHERVKAARWPEARDTAALIDGLASAGGDVGSLVIDAAWAWRSAAEALAELSIWSAGALAWLEDPFPGSARDAYARLRSRATHPLAAGDELTSRATVTALIGDGSLDWLRVDATTAGGVSGARTLTAAAGQAGLPVSLHVYPELHAHLAAAWPECRMIECFDEHDRAVDPSHRLTGTIPEIRAGLIDAPRSPGVGWSFDWELIRRYAPPAEAGAGPSTTIAKEPA